MWFCQEINVLSPNQSHHLILSQSQLPFMTKSIGYCFCGLINWWYCFVTKSNGGIDLVTKKKWFCDRITRVTLEAPYISAPFIFKYSSLLTVSDIWAGQFLNVIALKVWWISQQNYNKLVRSEKSMGFCVWFGGQYRLYSKPMTNILARSEQSMGFVCNLAGNIGYK